MDKLETRTRVDDALALFKQRAAAEGIDFDQAVKQLLGANRKFTPEERVVVSAYFRSQHTTLQPSLTSDEIREGLM